MRNPILSQKLKDEEEENLPKPNPLTENILSSKIP